MDKFIQRENLALLIKRLADPGLTDAQRRVIVTLLNEEHFKITRCELLRWINAHRACTRQAEE